jgi:hypothetical protein
LAQAVLSGRFILSDRFSTGLSTPENNSNHEFNEFEFCLHCSATRHPLMHGGPRQR